MSTLKKPASPVPGKIAPSKPDPETVTISGYVVDETYGPEAVQTANPKHTDQSHERIGQPGQFPYTRGIHSSGYRGKFWTMRQFAGFGTPEETNGRFKYLLKEGQTGLSVAYDLPALMGYDADSPLSTVAS